MEKKPLNEQVVVITGASSGIGRETAIQFGKHGASVVLAARNEEGLHAAALEVQKAGGTTLVVPTDVADWGQVQTLAQQAVDRFGRIDTWVNDASIAQYSTFEQTTIEEFQQIVQVNLMGVVHGTKAALYHMRPRREGTIINVGSALSKRAVPILVAYCAAKHGVQGFTEGLRMELEEEGMPITLTLIMPSSMNTPFFAHARSKLGALPRPIPPVYEPIVVADAILFAAQHPRKEIVAGGSGKAMILLERINPRLADWYMHLTKVDEQQVSDMPDDPRDNLYEPIRERGGIRGQWSDEAKSTSLYTKYVEYYPGRQRALVGAVMGGIFALFAGIGRAVKRS